MNNVKKMNKMIREEGRVKPREIAAKLGISLPTTYRLIQEGAFTYERLRGTYDVEPTSVDAFIASRTTTAITNGETT
jgi:excisionase family DNA binding protein